MNTFKRLWRTSWRKQVADNKFHGAVTVSAKPQDVIESLEIFTQVADGPFASVSLFVWPHSISQTLPHPHRLFHCRSLTAAAEKRPNVIYFFGRRSF